MTRFRFSFRPAPPQSGALAPADALILLLLAALIYAGVRMTIHAPAVVTGPEITLAPRALPWYALLSVGRMTAAYLLSLLFSVAYAYAAARYHAARRVLMPLLDVLQSVPILSFLPVVLLSLVAVLPQAWAAELAAIVLIFTSQVWNLTFSFYQSLTTLPQELREAAAVFRFRRFLRFRAVELPFAAIPLLWNSVMSWAGGWFFLMASESYRVGTRDFRLPGLGSYLQAAADAGDLRAVGWGIGALVLVIVLLDQLVWRPLLAWADRFKVEMIGGDDPPRSWFRDLLAGSRLLAGISARVVVPLSEHLDGRARAAEPVPSLDRPGRERTPPLLVAAGAVLALVVVYGGVRAVAMLATLSAASWRELMLGLGATFLRVMVALLAALVWTVPLGVAIGTNRRLAAILQPLVQVVASVPATALFPVLLLGLLRLPGGLDIAAIVLMLLGTQWYLLFNVIAGATAIPQDLRATTELLRLGRWDRWRTLVLPALFPYLVTGLITAGGGAWNASIVAEHVVFGERTYMTRGVGAVIAAATNEARYPQLLAGTLLLVVAVVLVNRTFWQRLYRVAEERYRVE
ncbi:MAG: ABC transporter permease subunit [Thermoanaerobaculia bacterium]|nr:ABC transporter permease subunit [Thermoanaerobaculia bacterium]